MSKLFCLSPGLRVLERQMQEPPGYRPRGYGICIIEEMDWKSWGNYSEIVDCVISRIKDHYGVEVTYEQQANAMNVWHIAKYNTTAMQEGDAFDDGWANWNGGGDVTYYDLPASEVGGKVVELAMSRLGHHYSQTYRGKDNYVDCSYLTLWCYRQVGIILPGTAAEQGRYLVEHNLTIAKEDLQPGDFVFWSYKPNGRFMNITHVGIYAGDGKVVDASYSKGKVVYRNLFDEDKQVLYGRPQ